MTSRTMTAALPAVLALLGSPALTAQQVGEVAPEIEWRETVGFADIPSQKLSQLRGSAVLLEFWGTH